MRFGVSITVSVIIGIAASLTATPGVTQDLQLVCDADQDSTITVEEARGCAGRRFDVGRGSANGLAEEQSGAAVPTAESLRQQFAQADQDGDGQISRDEWMLWFGRAYAETSEATQGETIGTE